MAIGKWPRRVSLPSTVDGRCVFCGIVEGTQPASIVIDEPDVLAFCDIQPINPGHLLVVPKRHAAGLADLDDATGGRMWAVARRLARALRASGLPCDGVNLMLADGAAAGQEIWHVHLHVVPRRAGDGVIRLTTDWSLRQRSELDDVAARVRSVLPPATGPRPAC